MVTQEDIKKGAKEVTDPIKAALGLDDNVVHPPASVSPQHYDTTYGVPSEYTKAADRYRKGLSPDLKRQQDNLARMKAYASGQLSQSRDTGAAQTAAQRARLTSLGQSAQRGQRSGAAERGAAYAGDQATRNIGAQTEIAAQLERQAAAKAYANAAAAHAQQQLGMEKAARGYSQLGIQDKQRMAEYNQMLEQLYRAKRAKAAEHGIEEYEGDVGFWGDVAGVVSDVVGIFT